MQSRVYQNYLDIFVIYTGHVATWPLGRHKILSYINKRKYSQIGSSV
jgi:hypothetical protein